MENYIDSQPEEEGSLHTPPKARNTFQRRPRDSFLSPGSIRKSKINKIKDDALFEKVQIIIRAELSLLRSEMERELATAKEAFKTQLHMELTVSFQSRIRAEMEVAEALWRKELENERAEMEKEMIKIKEEYKEALSREVADLKSKSEEAKEDQPKVMEELNNIKEHVKNLKEEEQKKVQKTSSWADKLFKTQKKA